MLALAKRRRELAAMAASGDAIEKKARHGAAAVVVVDGGDDDDAGHRDDPYKEKVMVQYRAAVRTAKERIVKARAAKLAARKKAKEDEELKAIALPPCRTCPAGSHVADGMCIICDEWECRSCLDQCYTPAWDLGGPVRCETCESKSLAQCVECTKLQCVACLNRCAKRGLLEEAPPPTETTREAIRASVLLAVRRDKSEHGSTVEVLAKNLGHLTSSEIRLALPHRPCVRPDVCVSVLELL